MFKTILTRPDLLGGRAKLEERWRAFAAEAGASFFQDWTWVGCLAAERYPDPVLLEVERDGRTAALALFNRRNSRTEGDSFYLHESDDPVLDSIFTEHNGPILSATDPVLRQALLANLLTQAMTAPIDGVRARPRRLVLSGVEADCAAASVLTGGFLDEGPVRVAPYVDFAALPPGQPFVERLSRNTRHQLRRSNRHYEAHGPLRLRRAETVEEALRFLSRLIELHEITWRGRGKPGAFATPAVRAFHQALITLGVPRGEVDLLQVTAGETTVGFLMNFCHRGTASAYQSGFDYGGAGPHQKPGLTSHVLAIEAYRARGMREYDFLAGGDRYKLSLANAQRWMHWLSIAPPWHPKAVTTRVRRLLRI